MPLFGIVPTSTREPEQSRVNGHHVQGNPAQGATQLLGHLHAGFIIIRPRDAGPSLGERCEGVSAWNLGRADKPITS